LKRLHAVAFFEGWPPDAIARAEAHVERGERTDFLDDPAWPALAIASISFDFETFDGPRRYVELMKEFAAASFGVFNPTKITARRRGDQVVLRFEHLGDAHEHLIPWEEDSDWIEDEFLDALWDACDDLPGKLHFQHIPCGQAGGFVLASDAAYDRAVAAGLLPPREEKQRRRSRSPDRAATPEARRFLARIDELGYFERMPASLADRLRQRVIQAAAQKKVPAVGLAIAEVKDKELETEEGARRLISQILENAPELFPERVTFDVRREGDALAYTFEAGQARLGGVHPHSSETRDFVIDFLISDLDDIRKTMPGAPSAVRIIHDWREHLKGKPWRVVVVPDDEQFDDYLIRYYEDKKR
jgi:hypothetical protein